MDYDVIVVGAGPAGSTAAKCLAEHKINVLLLDKSDFPRDKPCGGGLPTRVLRRFSYIEPFVNSTSYGSITHSSNLEYEYKLVRDDPLIVMVHRDQFDKGLVQLAIKQGAKFQSGKEVVDVKIYPSKAEVFLDDGSTFTSKMIIGCDGIRSMVAKKTKLCDQVNDICLSIVQEQPMSQRQLDGYFGKERIIHLFIKVQGLAGYGWIFPKKNHINIGIGEFESAVDRSKSKVKLKDSYNDYIAFLKKNKFIPEDFKIENLTGSILPVFPLETTYTDRVLLCGDAAGFINPITGEGIYYAMASGEIAAEVAREALQEGQPSKRYLSRYQNRWMNDFGKDLKLFGRFNNQWGRKTERLVRLLSKDEKFAQLIIGVTGGRVSFYKYRRMVYLRYLYVLIKELFLKK